MAQEYGPRVTIAVAPKSVGIAIILSVLFGPLGMFYSTITGAIVMMVVTFVAALVTAGLGLLVTWPVCVVWGGMAASAHNKKLMSGVQAVVLVLAALTIPRAAAAQSCKPNVSGKDKITKAAVDEWTQSLYQTGFLAAAVVTTSEVNITGSIARVGGDNNFSVVLTKQESNVNRAALESALRAEKGNEFLFGFKEGGEPWRFVADAVSNNAAADMFGKLHTTVVLTARIKDDALSTFRASLDNRQIDSVRIALGNGLTIDKSVKDGDGRRFAQKIACFLAFAEQKGLLK